MPKKTVLEKKQIWCNNMRCKNDACVRRINTAPFGVVLTVSKFNKDNNPKCKDFLEEWPEEKKKTLKKTVGKTTDSVAKTEKSRSKKATAEKAVKKNDSKEAKHEKPKTTVHKENTVMEDKKPRAISAKTLIRKVSAGTVDTASKEYKEMMLRLDPVKVVKCFEDAGWNEYPRKRNDIKVFQFTRRDLFEQVTVPLSKDLRDYKHAMADAICKIALIEKESAEPIKNKESEAKTPTVPKEKPKKSVSTKKADEKPVAGKKTPKKEP